MRLKTVAAKVGNRIVDRRKILLGCLVGLALLSVAVQLVYPYGRAMPLASVAGKSVGMQEHPAITLAIQESFSKATVTLRAGDVEQTDELTNLGASVDADTMASHAVNYPLLYRFVPFSIFWYQPQLDRYRLEFDDKRLAEMSADLAKQLSVKPVDAGIDISKGDIKLTEAKDGQQVAAETIRNTLVATSYNWDNTAIDVKATLDEPKISNASVADIREQAERVLAQQITISIDDVDDFKPDRQTIASWLKLDKTSGGSLRLVGNDEELNKYAKSLADKTSKKPTDTVVTTVDDRETNRKTGKSGLGIAPGELVNQLNIYIETPQNVPVTVVAERKPIKPPVRYVRNYTSSQAGLQAYVKDMSNSGDIYIAVRQLSNGRWSADGKSDKSIPSASTYKPMLMLRVFDDINSKKLKWSTKIGGETVQQCFERMIVLSANECAEALIERYGVHKLTDYLHDKGFSKGTGFTFSEATQTTAADLAKLMVGIHEGDLLSRGNRGMMLEKMGRQIYRQGIPAGTTAKAYGKVGFLWDYIHDVEIVNHHKGTYVLAVMTKDESWKKIADITRDIEAILYGEGIKSR